MFFSFFRSLGGSDNQRSIHDRDRAGLSISQRCRWASSTHTRWGAKSDSPLRALMTRAEADGTTETAACRFWMVS